MDNVCQYCGSPLTGKLTKKFCDVNCRKNHSRIPSKALKRLETIKWNIFEVAVMLQRKPASRTKEAMTKLKQIENDVSHLLRMYDRARMIEEAERAELIAREKR